MKHAYLEVTYRKGRPLAAYYYLPRKDGDKSARTQRTDGGFIIDFDANDKPIGIEITCLSALDVSQLNQLLQSLGQKPVASSDLAPLNAA
jgi:hypothetical protein